MFVVTSIELSSVQSRNWLMIIGSLGLLSINIIISHSGISYWLTSTMEQQFPVSLCGYCDL